MEFSKLCSTLCQQEADLAHLKAGVAGSELEQGSRFASISVSFFIHPFLASTSVSLGLSQQGNPQVAGILEQVIQAFRVRVERHMSHVCCAYLALISLAG